MNKIDKYCKETGLYPEYKEYSDEQKKAIMKTAHFAFWEFSQAAKSCAEEMRKAIKNIKFRK